MKNGMKMMLSKVTKTGLMNLKATTKVSKTMRADATVKVPATTLTEPSTLVAGKKVKDMATVSFLFMTAPVSKVIG